MAPQSITAEMRAWIANWKPDSAVRGKILHWADLLDAEVQHLRTERDALRTEKEARKADILGAVKEVRDLIAAKDKAEAERDALRVERDSAELKLEMFAELLTKSGAKRDALQQDVAELKRQVDTYVRALDVADKLHENTRHGESQKS